MHTNRDNVPLEATAALSEQDVKVLLSLTMTMPEMGPYIQAALNGGVGNPLERLKNMLKSEVTYLTGEPPRNPNDRNLYKGIEI